MWLAGITIAVLHCKLMQNTLHSDCWKPKIPPFTWLATIQIHHTVRKALFSLRGVNSVHILQTRYVHVDTRLGAWEAQHGLPPRYLPSMVQKIAERGEEEVVLMLSEVGWGCAVRPDLSLAPKYFWTPLILAAKTSCPHISELIRQQAAQCLPSTCGSDCSTYETICLWPYNWAFGAWVSYLQNLV
jgi:hypothetical protein